MSQGLGQKFAGRIFFWEGSFLSSAGSACTDGQMPYTHLTRTHMHLTLFYTILHHSTPSYTPNCLYHSGQCKSVGFLRQKKNQTTVEKLRRGGRVQPGVQPPAVLCRPFGAFSTIPAENTSNYCYCEALDGAPLVQQRTQAFFNPIQSICVVPQLELERFGLLPTGYVIYPRKHTL